MLPSLPPILEMVNVIKHWSFLQYAGIETPKRNFFTSFPVMLYAPREKWGPKVGQTPLALGAVQPASNWFDFNLPSGTYLWVLHCSGALRVCVCGKQKYMYVTFPKSGEKIHPNTLGVVSISNLTYGIQWRLWSVTTRRTGLFGRRINIWWIFM